MSGPVIGIDLGTTNSAVATLGDEGPRLIPNALGEVLTPSVVAVDDDGKLLVGRAARELQVLHPDRCAALFKRLMGTDQKTTLGKQTFTPEELSSLVLRTLKADAEAFFSTPVTRAVISVPAYFNDRQRKATMHAGQIAGLTVERILNEPTAAALAYGLHELQDEKILLVFDLGGGTLDVSVVELFAGTLEVRASSGESILGGEDFTRALAARVLERTGVSYELAEAKYPLQVARLLQQCEIAKRKLSRQDSAPVRVPTVKGELPDNAAVVDVARADFDKWTRHILARVELPLRRALGDAKLTPKDINEVILVGGATRMPAIVERVQELLGQPPRCRLNPDEVVALGAAVQAGLLTRAAAVEDLVVTDVSPFTLGIAVCKNFGNELVDGYYLPIIHRNTTLPVSRVERVGTTYPNQTQISVKIYQGEGRRVEDNVPLGEFDVKGIPRGPAGQSVDIRFTYDLNGVLEAEATVVETKKVRTHLITRHAK